MINLLGNIIIYYEQNGLYYKYINLHFKYFFLQVVNDN